jgi:cephalosporin hydroxylase
MIPGTIFQDRQEFAELLRVFKALAPRRVLEIGSLYGGTLQLFMQAAEPGAFFVSVDKLTPEGGSAHRNQVQAHDFLFHEWAETFGHKFRMLERDSTEPLTAESVKHILGDIDFIFFDGDHSERALREDIKLYIPMLRAGGVAAFHDIEIESVKKVWTDLKVGNKTQEFIIRKAGCGIGVLYKLQA